MVHMQGVVVILNRHSALHTRLLAHNPVDLRWLAVARRREQHPVGDDCQNAEAQESQVADQGAPQCPIEHIEANGKEGLINAITWLWLSWRKDALFPSPCVPGNLKIAQLFCAPGYRPYLALDNINYPKLIQ